MRCAGALSFGYLCEQVPGNRAGLGAQVGLGMGMGAMIHLLPFHCSASGMFCVVPTVMQAAGVQEMLAGRRRGCPPGGGGGVGRRWIVQWAPFHCSAMPAAPPS